MTLTKLNFLQNQQYQLFPTDQVWEFEDVWKAFETNLKIPEHRTLFTFFWGGVRTKVFAMESAWKGRNILAWWEDIFQECQLFFLKRIAWFYWQVRWFFQWQFSFRFGWHSWPCRWGWAFKRRCWRDVQMGTCWDLQLRCMCTVLRGCFGVEYRSEGRVFDKRSLGSFCRLWSFCFLGGGLRQIRLSRTYFQGCR